MRIIFHSVTLKHTYTLGKIDLKIYALNSARRLFWFNHILETIALYTKF